MTTSTSFVQMANNQSISLSSALRANTPPIKKSSTSRKFLTLSIFFRLLLVMFLTLTVSASAWGADYSKNESWNFSTTGNSNWSGHNSGYCGACGNKSSAFNVYKTNITNFSNIDFSKYENVSLTIYVKAGTNSGTNSYTVKLIDANGNQVSTYTSTKTSGMGNGTNSSSAKESSVSFNPTTSFNGYKIEFPAKAYITQTRYVLTYDDKAASCTVNPTVGTTLQSVTATENSIKATVPISSVGGCNITENGLVYSTTNSTPTVGGSGCSKVTTTACGSTAANKTVTITGLNCGTSYYIRGYATNEAGTSYTNVTTKSTSDCPKYTVKFYKTSTTFESVTEASVGAGVAPPSMESKCGDWTFRGWSESQSNSETSTTELELVTLTGEKYYPTEDVDLYPVYTKTEGGGGSTTTTFTFSSIASAKNWSNGNAYTPVVISPITITANGGGNNAKYYTSDQTWRMYNGGSLTITTSTGNITNVSSNPSYTFTMTNGTATCTFSETTKFKSITVTSGGGSTTYYYSYPQCTTEPSYSVTYNLNGGTGTCPTQEAQTGGSTFTLASSDGISKTGYNFAGWNDGTTTYEAGDTYTMPNNPVTLTAQWTPIEYTLSLESTLNCVDNGSVIIEYNATSAKTFTPATRDDYTCTGYWSAPSGGVQVLKTDGTFVGENVNGFITDGKWINTTATKLTPRWETEYKMILSKGTEENGTYTLSTTNIETSECATSTTRQVTITATPNTGYEVDQITYNGDGTATKKSGPTLSAGKTTWVYTFAENDKGTGTFTVTFKSLPKYTVSFSTGTGNPTQADIAETTANAGITLPIGPTPTCTDWAFAGWATASVTETTTEPTLLSQGNNYKPASDCTLHAVYSYTEAGGGGSGVTFNFSNIATANSWTNGTAYTTVTISPITLNAIGGGNNGKYYTSNTSWRMYNGGSLQISTDIGKITSVSSNPSKTFTINDEGTATLSFSETTEFKSITVSYSSTTTTYNSNPTCLVPVWDGATIDKTALTVNCGGRSPMTGANGAAIISFPTEDIYNFTKDITIEATSGFLVSTSQSVDANYKSSVSLSPLVGTANANTFYDKHVYVRAEAPAMSEEDLSGTITIKNNKGETLQTFSVTADVTCTTYTLTLDDRGTKTTAEYYAGASVPKPKDPTGVCTDPIHYVFDGWATSTVAGGSTEYTKVTFPYSMPGQNKTLYAVYRYLEGGGNGDYNLVTSALDDWTGDYLIASSDQIFANGTSGGSDGIGAKNNKVDLSSYISGNTIPATEGDKYNVTLEAVTDGYVIKTKDGKYNYYTTNESNGISASTIGNADNYPITVKFVSEEEINLCLGGNAIGSVFRYNTDGYFRFYKNGGQQPVYLYKKADGTTYYTTSPVCGPHLAITEGKDIYVTGGNAGGTRDLVIAQQKVSYKATRLNVGPTSQVPDVKVATNGITVGGVVTTDVKVTIDQTKEQQTDGTYTITGTITVQYQPSANGKQEDIQVQLAVDYNAEARDNFTVHARSLPAEFVIVAKSGDKWYALNGDMSNSSSANPANGQVTLDSDANPTKATYAPCNTIYTFDGVPNTGDRTRVRFQGTDGAWLWASSGTNVGIQNKSLKDTPEGNNNAYNWKIETEDNITYKFHNDNNSRLLGLNGEKFGMYASGVQDIRILPYVEKCLYNYAPTNLKVSVLKETTVTLTWDAVAGATKYQYSTDATNWTDAGTEPTVTINGLEGNTKYIYYIRAYHEDAGVSQECIDYAEITFTTADCDDVPTNITYTADLNSITVSWTAAAPTATITYNTKEDGTGGGGAINNATSPCRISGGLNPNTTYYIQIFASGTCASPIIPVKTKDVEVDIVEWKTDGIVVDINTNEKISVSLENEVSFGSGIGTEATELFFSKYYEASYNVKLVAIYNGTKNIIDLTDYTIQYGKTSWESNYITLKDFGVTKGKIQPGEEIILYSMQDGTQDDDIMDCVHEKFPDGNWVEVTSSNNDGKGTLSFGGDKTIILCKTEYDDEADEYYDNIIDVIGALKDDPNEGILPTNIATEKPSWGDKEGWVCETGLSIADDSQIGISTNRCLLIRNNTVTSGDNAVTQNIDDFVTLCSEWKGAHVPDDAIDNGVAASCKNFAYVGTFDYSDYYTKYISMGKEQVFEKNTRNSDGTVTISIPELSKQSCRNIRIIIKDNNTKVISNQEYKVPIMITTTQGTAYSEETKNTSAFYALQENLATKEVDGNGNVIDTHPLSLEQVREICKTCDVVVRDNATLTKVTDGTPNDHPQVRNVYVYEGASIVIPDGVDHNYTINGLSLRRKGDVVASAQVQGTGKFVLPADEPVCLDLRVDANNWHWFTLPYDCLIEDVTWVDGTPAKYNTDWFLMYYDGKSRAASTNPYDNHWKVYECTTIEAGKGYIVGITGDLAHPDYTFELRFPMAQDVLTAEQTDKTVPVNAWGVKSDNKPNNLGWNLVGNPYLNYYKTAAEYSPLAGLPLIEYTGIDPVTGDRLYDDSGNVPYVATPIDGGWYEYRQELASEVNMMPFTAYFVQVGDPNTHENGQDLNASFEASNRGKKSIVRRAPREVEEIEEPIIVRVELTNSKGESDKTSLVIDDRFTNEYEMNGDFFKWFGDYYNYYTKPVLYTIGADQGKRAFNALNEELAKQPIPMGMYAAQAGNYTFSLNQQFDLSRVEEVWLYDATQSTYTNLMQSDYTFSTSKVNGAGRFSLSVKLAPKVATSIDNVTADKVWATTHTKQVIVNGLENGMHLWLYDATGKLLYTEPTSNYQHTYSVPQTGTYFVSVMNGNAKQTIKVVVE